MIGVSEGEGGGVVPGESGSGNLNPGRGRGGAVDRRSVGEENKRIRERRRGGEETRRRGEERGGAVFLAM